jgi:hypothetical protein
MFRTTDLVLTAVMLSAAAFTYKTKYEAENLMAEVRRLESEKRMEEDSMVLLKADWSLLTQPARLQRLAEIYQNELALQPPKAEQIVSIDQVPMKPMEIDDLDNRHLGGMATSGEGLPQGSMVR